MIDRLIKLLKNERLWWRMESHWNRAVATLHSVYMNGLVEDKALIIPCDPWCVVGSRGDQAMIIATIQSVQAHHSQRKIEILTDSHNVDENCRALGLVPVADWNVPIDEWFPRHAVEYAEVYILGADVTDGFYWWFTSARLLAYYDLFWRLSRLQSKRGRGVFVKYLGFSWSQCPSPMMKRIMRRLVHGLPLPIRDPVSYERVARFTRHRPLLQVADAAFQLKPNSTPRARKWIDWCRGKKSEGRRVIAINVHQMFNDAETKLSDWEVAFSKCLEEVAKRHLDIIYLLVPHDNRPRVSDLEILKRINGLLQNSTLIDVVMNADEIKAVLGECDALVAGRMHISIAAFGQGIPVLGLVYQGKFEGLWAHFGLPSDLLLAPKLFLDNPSAAILAVGGFIAKLNAVRTQIQKMLPSVLELSGRNFK